MCFFIFLPKKKHLYKVIIDYKAKMYSIGYKSNRETEESGTMWGKGSAIRPESTVSVEEIRKGVIYHNKNSNFAY